MNVIITANHWRIQQLSRFFHFVHTPSLIRKLILCVSIACIIGALSQLKITLFWTPVPIVMATLGVLVAPVLIGKYWASASVICWTAGALIGIPWTANGQTGMALLVSPTMGYIIGYIFAAYFIGHMRHHVQWSHTWWGTSLLMGIASIFIIYIPGLIGLYAWSSLIRHTTLSLRQLCWMGMIPFLGGDIIKTLVAVVLTKLVSQPK